MASVFAMHGIKTTRSQSKVLVPMSQPAEPLIPLLLDERGIRSAIAAKAVNRC